MQSWKLEDATLIQKEAPYTFYKPSDEIISKLKPGEATVKLIFQFESDQPDQPRAERMWVLLDTINPDGTFSGALDNEPLHIKDLKAGDLINFGKQHIIQYQTIDEITPYDENAELIERYHKRCMVSNKVIKEDKPVGYLVKEPPMNEKDSGWFIMAGDEDEAYQSEPDNFQYVSLGAILNKDDSFIRFLDGAVGSEFERDQASGSFLLID